MRSPKIKRYDKSRPSPIRYDKKVRWTWCDETGDKILLHLGVMRQERKKIVEIVYKTIRKRKEVF